MNLLFPPWFLGHYMPMLASVKKRFTETLSISQRCVHSRLRKAYRGSHARTTGQRPSRGQCTFRGYVQAHYQWKYSDIGLANIYSRYEGYRGGIKFQPGAPSGKMSEWETCIAWQPDLQWEFHRRLFICPAYEPIFDRTRFHHRARHAERAIRKYTPISGDLVLELSVNRSRWPIHEMVRSVPS